MAMEFREIGGRRECGGEHTHGKSHTLAPGLIPPGGHESSFPLSVCFSISSHLFFPPFHRFLYLLSYLLPLSLSLMSCQAPRGPSSARRSLLADPINPGVYVHLSIHPSILSYLSIHLYSSPLSLHV